MVIIFILKKRLDTKPKSYYLRRSVSFVTLEYILKFLAYTISSFLVYPIEILRKINRGVFDISSSAIYYNNAKKQNYLEYILFCDFYGRLGRIAFGILMIFIFLIFGETIEVLFYLFLLAIGMSFGLRFFKEQT